MYANERREHLNAVIASLTDHLLDQVAESVEGWQRLGRDNWRGTSTPAIELSRNA